MVIVVCTDDDKLLQLAQQQANTRPTVFGKCYLIFKDQIPQLGQSENLFIGAHGAFKGDDGNPVIGDKEKAFYVNAVDFHANIKGIFPDNYQGKVFIYACESADYAPGSFSFAEVFKAQLQVGHPKVRVYGQKGEVGLKGVVGPEDKGWVEIM